MKALTIKEPWCSLILEGKKTIETRVQKTKHRGPIILHCAKNPRSKLSGKIFAVANLVDCRRMSREDEKQACCRIYPGANSWVLEDIKAIEQVEIKGQLSLWDYNSDILILKKISKSKHLNTQ